MGKRIPRILLLVIALTSADAILRTDPNVARRYGPPSKRPGFANYPLPQYGPPPSTTGQYMAPPGHSSYQSSTGYPSSTYGNPGAYPTVHAKPPSTSYGPPPSAPSVSYSRPFGLPEGHRFPNGGYTFKLPQVPPPRPPVKALYISKPYPDYVIRFKSPSYPAEVPILSKPGYGNPPPAIPPYQPVPAMPSPPSYPLPSYSPPAPVYEPTGPIKSPIPIYENPSGNDKQVVTVIASTQDVNVGTSYQTGSNFNQYHSGLPSKIPVYSEAPSSLPLYPGQPPSTSAVYVISNDRLSNDKPMTGANNVKTFVELSNDQAFGVTQQPGVIRPLTPDIVYSPNDPNNGVNFKPMYLFGPMFFPKGEEGAARDSSSSGSSSVSTELKSAVVVVKNQTVTNSDVAEAVEAVAEDPVDDAKDAEPVRSSGGGSGGGRGILGVVESILGIDDDLDDLEDGMSRADEEETEAETEPEESRNTEPQTSDRDSDGKRKSRPKYKSRSKTRPSSTTRRKNRNKPKGSNSNRGHDVGGEPLEPAEEKDQEAPKRPTAAVKNPESGTVPEYGENEHSQGEDEPEPVIGPVQIGYIGRPPQGATYDPNHPFFYPAGISPYVVQGFVNDPEQSPAAVLDDAPEAGGVRRHFGSTEGPVVYEQSQNAHQMDLMVAPTAELEQPVPQEVSALDNQKQDVDIPETSTVAQETSGFNRPMYAHNYPSYYDTASVQGQGYDAASVQGQGYGTASVQGQGYDAASVQGQGYGTASVQGQGYNAASVQGPAYERPAPLSGSSSERQHLASTPQHSAEYVPGQDTVSGPLQTGSYSSEAQDTKSTAYADNSGSDDAPSLQPSVPASSYLQVDQDISSTVTDHIDARPNELSPDTNLVSQLGEVSDKHDAASVSHAPDTQYDYSSRSPLYADPWPSSSESAHAVTVDSVAVETSTPASSDATKRPFPSFHHYRVGYRPKYNRNYIPPTTYRPAYRHPSSSVEEHKEPPVGDDIDTSATIYNSLHYDITTTSAPINLDEHFNFDATTSDTQTGTKPGRGNVRYGDKISPKQKPS